MPHLLVSLSLPLFIPIPSHSSSHTKPPQLILIPSYSSSSSILLTSSRPSSPHFTPPPFQIALHIHLSHHSPPQTSHSAPLLSLSSSTSWLALFLQLFLFLILHVCLLLFLDLLFNLHSYCHSLDGAWPIVYT